MESKATLNEKEKVNGHEKILSINFNQDQGFLYQFLRIKTMIQVVSHAPRKLGS